MWVYIQTELGVFTTGFYRGDFFNGDADFATREGARERCSFLNGGPGPDLHHIKGHLLDISEKLNRLPGGG